MCNSLIPKTGSSRCLLALYDLRAVQGEGMYFMFRIKDTGVTQCSTDKHWQECLGGDGEGREERGETNTEREGHSEEQRLKFSMARGRKVLSLFTGGCLWSAEQSAAGITPRSLCARHYIPSVCSFLPSKSHIFPRIKESLNHWHPQNWISRLNFSPIFWLMCWFA